jgi:hypothetical protein
LKDILHAAIAAERRHDEFFFLEEGFHGFSLLDPCRRPDGGTVAAGGASLNQEA